MFQQWLLLGSWLYAHKNHPHEPVGLIGVSLGGAAAVLAAPLDLDALVLESVYSTLATAVHNRVAARLGPLSWLPAEILLAQLKPRLGFSAAELSPVEMIRNINCPVFIVSGTKDLHTTEVETTLLFNSAHGPKHLWLVGDVAIYLMRGPKSMQKEFWGF